MIRKLFNKIPLTGITRQSSNFQTFRKSNTTRNERITTEEIFGQAFTKRTISTNEDWNEVREKILNYSPENNFISPVTVDAMIISYCTDPDRYHLAKSYLQFLNEQKVKPNLATIGRYLKLLYEKNVDSMDKKNKPDEDEILSIYKELRSKYPSLDSITLEHAVLSLSVTKDWKACIELLNEIKVTAMPSRATYSAIIGASFLNGEEDLGWKYLNEMLENARAPKSIAYISYLRSLKSLQSNIKVQDRIEKLFEFLKFNDIRLERDVIEMLQELSEKLKIETKVTSLDKLGVCRNCKKPLDTFELTDEEFSTLKDRIFQNVILGKDVFVRTNPRELAHFNEFIAQKQKFDVVLDGLNIAYSCGTQQNPDTLSTFVACVVKHFVDQKLNVLVLGRVHMNKWRTRAWDYVQTNSTVFLTQNISEDDPYLLYCAVNSGKNTKIITRDLMRSHKFLLKSHRLKVLFNRWLSQRQYQLVYVDQRKRPVFKDPMPFSPNTQKNEECWHLPFDAYDNPKNEYHNSWNCLRFK